MSTYNICFRRETRKNIGLIHVPPLMKQTILTGKPGRVKYQISPGQNTTINIFRKYIISFLYTKRKGEERVFTCYCECLWKILSKGKLIVFTLSDIIHPSIRPSTHARTHACTLTSIHSSIYLSIHPPIE